ncbi:MAG: sugar transferase [Deltaproteobacteria bacterium]|nr:sugar transferase [Deltaproteobacteria bacterium]
MLPRTDQTVERVVRAVLDLGAFLLAANLAFDLRYYLDWGELLDPGPAPWAALYQAMPYMLLGWFLIFAVFGLYRPDLKPREEIALVVKAQLVAFAVIFAMAFFYRGFSYSRGAAVFLVPLALVLTLLFRTGFRLAKQGLFRLESVAERVLIVGYSAETDRLIQGLRRPDSAYALLGILAREGRDTPEGVARLGDLGSLASAISEAQPDRVLLISGDLDHAELIAAIDTCLESRCPWAVVPDLYDMLLDRLHLDEVVGIPVMGPHGSRIVGLNRVVKRTLDLLLSLLLLILLAPVMGAVALVIRASSGGPVLFRQQRIGRSCQPFELLKFRTMRTGAGEDIHRDLMERVIDDDAPGGHDRGRPVYKLKDDPRVTRAGRFLRRFSLDELPQLVNVLRGEMSLVGPRPAIPYEVERYRERHRRRLEAPPGITGLWQVSGRNRLSFEEMVELDIHYIENWTLGLDLRICFKTVAAVLFSRGY